MQKGAWLNETISNIIWIKWTMSKQELKENDAHIYSAWRKHEAYQVPVTEEGEYKAMRRFESFKAGWLQAEQRMKGNNKEK